MQDVRYQPTIESENMNTKHTPGPWFRACDYGANNHWTDSNKWQQIVNEDKDGNPAGLICLVNRNEGNHSEANAQLIAAAPELLDFAIIVSRSACLQQVNGNECICFACLAKKLVDKATK